jgi:four helix bundle protein
MYRYSFERLDVWKISIDLVEDIYNITNNFPDSEKYALISQLRRSAISISSNISEGSSRKSYKDKARFTQIAYSSLMEMLNQIIISHKLDYLDREQYTSIRTKIAELSNKLNAYYNPQIH